MLGLLRVYIWWNYFVGCIRIFFGNKLIVSVLVLLVRGYDLKLGFLGLN